MLNQAAENLLQEYPGRFLKKAFVSKMRDYAEFKSKINEIKSQFTYYQYTKAINPNTENTLTEQKQLKDTEKIAQDMTKKIAASCWD